MDDWPVVAKNPHLTDSKNVQAYFTSGVWNNTGIPDDEDDYLYRPIFLTTLFLAYQMFGTEPLGYHLLNLSLHIGNTLLVFFLLILILKTEADSITLIDSRFHGNDVSNNRGNVSSSENNASTNRQSGLPLFVALVFAVHPVHSESISWIAAITDPLVTLFILGSFITFLLHRENQKKRFLITSLGLFALGLLSKETAVMLPFIIITWLTLEKTSSLLEKRNLITLGLYFTLLIIYFALRKNALGNTIALNNINLDGFIILFSFAAEYIKLLFVPWPMNYYYAIPHDGILQTWGAVVSLLIIAGIIYAIIKQQSQRKLILFSLFWIGLTLLPSLSLAFHESPGFSVRFLYLPSAGLAILLLALLTAPFEKHKTASITSGAILLAVFSVITIMANQIWKNELTFFTHAQQVTPKHAGPVSGFAMYYERNKQDDKAVEYYLKTARLGNNKVKAIAYEHIGLIYGIQGSINQSTEYYQKANTLKPNTSTILVGLGNNAWSRKDLQGALSFYTQAFNADKKNYHAAYNLSILYRTMGDMNRAAIYQQQAQQLK